MGLVFTFLFLLLSYLSPQELFPDLAPYRPMLVLTIVGVLFVAVGVIFNPRWIGTSETLFMLLLYGIIIVSLPLGGWLGGASEGLRAFALQFVLFLMVFLSCTKPWHIRVMGWLFFVVGVYYIVRGALAYHFGIDTEKFVYMDFKELDMMTGATVRIPRVRGSGFLEDPNDLAQNLILTMPFIWWAWRASMPVRNFLLVLVPTAFFLYGVALTRSRGGLLALMVLVGALLRRYIGYKAYFLAGGIGAFLLLVVNFGGGRMIGIGAGSGTGSSRLELWSEALGIIKRYPLRGVGLGQISDYMEQTTHNTFLYFGVEFGIPGVLVWVALIAVCLLHLIRLSKLTSTDGPTVKVVSAARSLLLVWYAYLAAAWFLTRSFTITLYVLIGMSAALWSMARQLPAPPPPLEGSLVVRTVLIACFACTLTVYVLVRLRWAS